MDIAPLVVTDRAKPGEPATHAIVIGVSRYLHFGDGIEPTQGGQDWGMTQLTAAAGSASEVAMWIAKEYRNPDVKIGTLRVLLSPGEDETIDPRLANHINSIPAATRENVSAAMTAFRRDCATNVDNVAIVYIAGHGVQLTKEESTVLLSDVGADHHDNILEGAIDVVRCHRGMDYDGIARRQFWFVDACRQRAEVADRFDKLPGAFAFDQPAGGSVEASPIFLATGPRESAFARPGKRTLFCEALLTCLRHGLVAPNNVCPRWHVSTMQLESEFSDLVDELAESEGETQTVHRRNVGARSFAILHQLEGHTPDEKVPPPTITIEVGERSAGTLEATVLMQWTGARPKTPEMTVSTGSWFGSGTSIVTAWHPIPSRARTARWRATIAIPRSFLTTVVRVRAGNVSSKRVLAPPNGSLVALLISMTILLALLLWFVRFGGASLVPSVVACLVGLCLNWLALRLNRERQPLMRLSPELAIVMSPFIAATSLIATPRLVVVIDNRSSIPIDGLIGEHTVKAVLGSPIVTLDPLTCRCGEPQCGCASPSSGWFEPRRIEVRCRSELDGKCVDAKNTAIEGLESAVARVPLDWPTGFHRVSFTPDALHDVSSFGSVVLVTPPTTWPTTRSDLQVMSGNTLKVSFETGGTLECTGSDGPLTVSTIGNATSLESVELLRGAIKSSWKRGAAGEAPRFCRGIGDAEIEIGGHKLGCADPSVLRAIGLGAHTASLEIPGVLIIPGSALTCSSSTLPIHVGDQTCKISETTVECTPPPSPPPPPPDAPWPRVRCYRVPGNLVADKPDRPCFPVTGEQTRLLDEMRDMATNKNPPFTCIAFSDCP